MELSLTQVGTEFVMDEEGKRFARLSFVGFLSEEEYVTFVTKRQAGDVKVLVP